MNFLKRVFSTVVGIFIFIFICFAFIIAFGMLSSITSKEEVTVKNKSVLNLKLDFPLNDYAPVTKIKDFPMLNEKKYNGLFSIINAIKYAATDSKIEGISIDNNFINAGIAQIKALRDALIEFKSSGKFIVSYADIYTQKDYYLNSVADTIYMNPVGALEFKGLSTERLYYKDFEDKSGLKMEVIKIGKYKSAAEPFLTNTMSENNREQIKVYLNGLWKTIKSEIAESRNTTPEVLDTMADSLMGRTASIAKTAKLIDKISYHDEYVSALKAQVGVEADKKLNTITIKQYAAFANKKLNAKTTKSKIAVIYAEGEIIYGDGNEKYVGQGSMNKALKKAREDDKIKAIVLRINSPGGSALASELIWREIELTKKEKPVIVSMGNVAASGGYYIACNANKIFAEASTITGSIGVFGMLPNVKGLADKIGINAEQVSTNVNALTYSPFEPLNDNQKKYIGESISNIYELFTNRVAEGRQISQDSVKTIAQGRVWTGTDALSNGLVDAIGGLDEALAYAAEQAEISEYKIKELPVFETNLEELFNQFGGIKSKALIKETLGTTPYKLFEEVKKVTEEKGPQVIFPYSLDIK